MKIIIGNLNIRTTTRQLADLFLSFGPVFKADIVRDASTGCSRGVGYIEMDHRSGRIAIQKLNRGLFMNAYMEINEII
jgi:RNA recognition motif-containing protein